MAGKGKIENLRPPWGKGQSGNPGGRPRRKSITQAYAKLAEAIIPEDVRRKLKLPFGIEVPPGVTWAQALSLGMFIAAIRGNAGAAHEIREAIEGRTGHGVDLGAGFPAVAQSITVIGLEEPQSPAARKALPAPTMMQSETDFRTVRFFDAAKRK